MNGSQERGYNFAFLLDERLLRDCVTLIESSIKLNHAPVSGSPPAPIGYLIEFSDGSAERLRSIEAVLRIPNDTVQQIRRISIGTELSYTPHVVVDFRSTGNSNTYLYSILENGEQQTSLASQLDRFGRRTRCWYTWIAFVGLPYYFTVGILVGIAAYPALTLVARAAKGSATSNPATWAVLFGTVVLSGAIALLLGRFRDWVFPVGLFVIGDGIVLLERLRFWRSLVGSGVLLAATVNIVTALVV